MLLKLPIMSDGVGGLQRTRGAQLELLAYLSDLAAFCLSNPKKPGLREIARTPKKEIISTQMCSSQGSAFNLVRSSEEQSES